MQAQDFVSLKIDLVAGTAEITAPPEHYVGAAREARELLALRQISDAVPPAKVGVSDALKSPDLPSAQATKAVATAKKLGRVAVSSSARTGRIGSFEPVPLELTETKERAIHDFFAQKQPKSQPEVVAVAMYIGEQQLGRKGLDYNEIYTLMRLGGVKDLPKALDVLISGMKKDNWITADESGFSLKFLARDHVEQKLPSQPS